MSLIKCLLLAILISTLFLTPSTNAQSFGFGCLGFVGGYGGYSYQVYEPTGLNDYILAFNESRKDSLNGSMGNFGAAGGYRVGLNFFRANLEGLILTAKGFYQSLSEKKEASFGSASGNSSAVYELQIRNWGLGIDLGTSITNSLSWKVIDAALLYNFAAFTQTINLPGSITKIIKYKNSKPTLGYFFGTGFIYNIIDNYISVEGVAGYTVFSINEMQTEKGDKLMANENSQVVMKKFITAGGFNAVIQINFGFPL